MTTPSQPGQAQQNASTYEQRLALSTLPVKELLARLPLLYATLHANIEQIGVIVDAIGNYAIFAEYNEDRYAALVNGTQEALALLQAVQEGEALSPAWLARREELMAWIQAKIHDQDTPDTTSKEGTNPP
jgi:hypothetical protein